MAFYFKLDTPKFYFIKNDLENINKSLAIIYKEKYINYQKEIYENDYRSIYGNRIGLKHICTYLKYPLFLGFCISFFLSFSGKIAISDYSEQTVKQFLDDTDNDKMIYFDIMI